METLNPMNIDWHLEEYLDDLGNIQQVMREEDLTQKRMLQQYKLFQKNPQRNQVDMLRRPDGQIQFKGLLPGQQVVQRSNGQLQIFSHPQRKMAKNPKNVKSMTMTQGKPEDYDIEKVLKSLENDEKVKKARKPKSKKKSKKKPQKSIIADSNLTESVEIEEASVELVESTSEDSKVGSSCSSPSPSFDDLEDIECTICFCIREKTFPVIPYGGHATFCQDCKLLFPFLQ